MPSFELKCKIVHVGLPYQATESLKKRDLIVTADYDQQYPQTLKIEALQDKCDDNFFAEARVDDEATIHFNLNGRTYDNLKTKKKEVFISMKFWKGQLTRTTAAPTQQQAATPAYAAPVDISNAAGQDDDLPF